MDIPVLTKFIQGIKLFLADRRLRWLTIVFLVGAAFIILFREIGRWLATTGIILFFGGIFPTFFLLTAFVSILGLQRFIASDETYQRSIILFIPWIIISAIVYALLFFAAQWLFQLLIIWVAFMGWIILQAYLSSRSALSYSEVVDVKHRSKASTIFFGSLNVVAYFIIWGALIGLVIINPAVLLPENIILLAAAAVGALLATGFNFFNGIIIIRERNKQTGDAVALLGIFVAFYVAYFMYNVLKIDTGGFDLFSLFVDIGISIFFVLYAMSSVGRTLAARAVLDTRWKMSKEFAATLTFFLASGYLFVEATLESLASIVGNPGLAALPDFIKLVLFPFIVLFTELLYLRRASKVLEAPPEPEEMPILEEEVPVEEPEEEPVEEFEEEYVEEVVEEEPEEDFEEDYEEELDAEPEWEEKEEPSEDSETFE
ncbi:MAG: hypothetical protein ACFE7R_11740 [Candidatus Hodarchaeota archaeon]